MSYEKAYVCELCGHISLIQFDRCPNCKKGNMHITQNANILQDMDSQCDSEINKASLWGKIITIIVMIMMLLSMIYVLFSYR